HQRVRCESAALRFPLRQHLRLVRVHVSDGIRAARRQQDVPRPGRVRGGSGRLRLQRNGLQEPDRHLHVHLSARHDAPPRRRGMHG
ncbi:hypothetical protein M9458_045322, partial [Cirrhinus mrigala]